MHPTLNTLYDFFDHIVYAPNNFGNFTCFHMYTVFYNLIHIMDGFSLTSCKTMLCLTYKSVNCLNCTLLIKALFNIPVLPVKEEHLFLGQRINIL